MNLKDFYQQQAEQYVLDIPWLKSLQSQAATDFARLGFPTRSHEEWKYTALDAWLQHPFVSKPVKGIYQAVKQYEAPILAYSVHLHNGEVVGDDALAQLLPAGVIVQSLRKALEEHAEKIQPYLGQILSHQHGFHALNTAILQSGIFVYCPPHTHLELPLIIRHWQDEPNQAVYSRHIVLAEQKSKLNLIELFEGQADCSYMTNSVTEVYAAEGSNVTHYKVQRESLSACHISHLEIVQHEHSQVHSHSLSLGGKLVRSDTTIHMRQPKARCLLNGIYALHDAQHIDHHTEIRHEVSDCESEQDYKGIIAGHSRAVFNGKIWVAKDAQHTKARQKNDNVLLSAQAEIDTKPQLEIYADDVTCAHGATVGQLDDDALFYLATRGIGTQEASRYLLQAFTAHNIRTITNEPIAHWFNQLMIGWMQS